MNQNLLKIRTLGELKSAGYKIMPVRIEMRNNLLERLRSKRAHHARASSATTRRVMPEIENGVLAGHHMIFLGERGQAKSRIIRSLAGLLDEFVPAVKGCEINDDPYRADLPAHAARLKAEQGDELEIAWIGRDHRYAEKLATPDVSVADLIGEIDPIKVAEGRYLADEETIHYGLIPRTNRGIFAINELPDLTEKVQVGSVQPDGREGRPDQGLQDSPAARRGVRRQRQSRGLHLARPDHHAAEGSLRHPDSHALPEDDRGRNRDHGAGGDAIRRAPAMALRIPQFIKEIIAQITFEARALQRDQPELGRVGARDDQQFRIGDLQRREARRAQRRERDRAARFRICHSLYASTAGKIELEYVGEDKKEEDLIERLINRAVLKVFDRYLKIDDLQEGRELLRAGMGRRGFRQLAVLGVHGAAARGRRACAKRSRCSVRSRRRA